MIFSACTAENDTSESGVSTEESEQSAVIEESSLPEVSDVSEESQVIDTSDVSEDGQPLNPSPEQYKKAVLPCTIKEWFKESENEWLNVCVNASASEIVDSRSLLYNQVEYNIGGPPFITSVPDAETDFYRFTEKHTASWFTENHLCYIITSTPDGKEPVLSEISFTKDQFNPVKLTCTQQTRSENEQFWIIFVEISKSEFSEYFPDYTPDTSDDVPEAIEVTSDMYTATAVPCKMKEWFPHELNSYSWFDPSNTIDYAFLKEIKSPLYNETESKTVPFYTSVSEAENDFLRQVEKYSEEWFEDNFLCFNLTTTPDNATPSLSKVELIQFNPKLQPTLIPTFTEQEKSDTEQWWIVFVEISKADFPEYFPDYNPEV